MIGTTNLPLRTGGWIIPVETTDSTNKILTVNVPAGSRIMCASCTLENQDTLASNGDILATTNGFVINKDINNLKILRPITETPPISILHGREILYSSDGVKRVNLAAPAQGGQYAVFYNGNIHLLMGTSNEYRYHCRWNGQSWAYVSTLPYKCNRGQAIVYNDEIHLLGGNENNTETNHYKWDGTTWTNVSTLPIDFRYGSVAVYNNEIHIIVDDSTNSNTSHYKWDGTQWTLMATLPYRIYSGHAIVYNDEIHLLGGYGPNPGRYHYKWDGTQWTSVSTLPASTSPWLVCIYKNDIHLLSQSKLYKFNGSTWIELANAPYSASNSAYCADNDYIHLISGTADSIRTNHFIWDGVSWKKYILNNAFNLPMGTRVNGIMCETTGDNIIPKKNNYLIEL